MKKLITISFMAMVVFASCTNEDKTPQEVQKFIDDYTQQYVKLYTNSSEAQWKANTEIKEGDSTNSIAAQKADEVMRGNTLAPDGGGTAVAPVDLLDISAVQ